MPVKAGLLSTKAWLRVPFVRNSLISAMADSNSCALVIRLQKEKRVVATKIPGSLWVTLVKIRR